MWSIKDVKTRGRVAFKANYWLCVLVGIVLSLLLSGGVMAGRSGGQSSVDEASVELETSVNSLQQSVEALPDDTKMKIFAAIAGISTFVVIVGILLKIFVWNPLKVGCYRFFAQNVEYTPAKLGCVADGFSDYGHVLVTLLLRDLVIAAGFILFVIPGFVMVYALRLVPYIIKDEPNLSAREVLSRSMQLMRGNKWRAFLLDLSFLGWQLLGILTLGIVEVFWTTPYLMSTEAALYLELTGR